MTLFNIVYLLLASRFRLLAFYGEHTKITLSPSVFEVLA